MTTSSTELFWITESYENPGVGKACTGASRNGGCLDPRILPHILRISDLFGIREL